MAGKEAAAKEAAAKERVRISEDLRHLMEQPAFVRYARRWIEKAGALSAGEMYSAEVYALNARRAFGMRMLKELMEHTPRQAAVLVTDLLTEPKE